MIINESKLNELISEEISLVKSEKLNLIKECTIAAVRLDNGIILAKNRDRGYVAKMKVVHEVVDDVEMVYWIDEDTDWSEGMNEYGIGIVNSSLLVRQDEKESDKIEKKQKDGKNYVFKDPKLDDTENRKKATDGFKIRTALKHKEIKNVVKSVISFSGDDKKNVGIKGQTMVGNNKNIYNIEATSKDTSVVTKLKEDKKVMVRTNHGIAHEVAGYTTGIKKKSSHMRMLFAKEYLKSCKTDSEVFEKMRQQYHKNPFFNPYREKNEHNMQTVGQIMLNLDKKEVTIRMDKNMGKFLGVDNRLPNGYEPKIKINVIKE